MTTASPTPLARYLAETTPQVEAALVAATQGQSVCAIHKAGAITPALKRVEGRHVILRELGRVAEQPAERVQAAFKELERVWREKLERYRQQEPPSWPWIEYYQGGVDELASARDVVASEAKAADTDAAS